MADKTIITVECTVDAPMDKVWEYWTNPDHITKWSFASDDWHSTHAENDLRVDGKFKIGMAAKDGSFSFDFEGTYTNVKEHDVIEYVLGDGRTAKIIFEAVGDQTKVTESFDAENENPVEMQKGGWQAILDNFKKHTESGS